MGKTLDTEQGFGSSNSYSQGLYAPTQTVYTTSVAKIKSLSCSLMSVIARTIFLVDQQMKKNGWDKEFDCLFDGIEYANKPLHDMKDKYLWNSFHTRFTLYLLTPIEKTQWLLTYLTTPIVLHVVYILFYTKEAAPSAFSTNSAQPAAHSSDLYPSLSSLKSLNPYQWVLFVLSCVWAILTLVWFTYNFKHWRDRCIIRGFKMDYIRGLQFRTLFIGLYLSYLMLICVPQLDILSCLMTVYNVLWGFIILAIISIRRFEGNWFWNDDNLYLQIGMGGRFNSQEATDLQNCYNKRHPDIELEDLCSRVRFNR